MDEMDEVDKAIALYKRDFPNIKIDVGYVYILRAANGLYKIGKTHNLKNRLKKMQTFSPVKIELYAVYKCEHCSDAERSLHELFDELRRIGEWFELSEEDLETIDGIGQSNFMLRCYL